MVELLSPAGNFEKMKMAFLYGADAVYLAGERFGMRAAADNFTNEELCRAVEFAHRLGKRIYLTLNTMPREPEYPALREFFVRTCRHAVRRAGRRHRRRYRRYASCAGISARDGAPYLHAGRRRQLRGRYRMAFARSLPRRAGARAFPCGNQGNTR